MENDILTLLRTRRRELLADLDRFNAAIAAIAPPPEPLPEPTPAKVQVRDRVLAALSTDQPRTALQVVSQTGIPSNQVYRALVHHVTHGRVTRRRVGGVHHFTRKPEELRLRAGEGAIE